MKKTARHGLGSDNIVRRLRASWRDTWLIFREFRWPLFGFCLAIFGGGVVYFYLSNYAGEPAGGIIAAIYQVLGLTFLQPIGDFPQAWYLEAFYFIMPVIGIGILAQGFADFGVLLFNRRARSKEWEMAVASTYSDHIVLIGLGHLGYRVVKSLCQMDQGVVVVELDPTSDTVQEVRKLGVTVLQDDGRRESALEAAGVRAARSLILCTQNDSLNLQIAVKARSMNPRIHVVIRIFDDDFAHALQEQFGFQAISATSMAAPAFASSAAGVDMTRPITVEGEAFSLARLRINHGSKLIGYTVANIEKEYAVSVILIRRDGAQEIHPVPGSILQEDDILAVFGGPAEINILVQRNSKFIGK